MKVKLLYPSDFFDIKKVDPDYLSEYETVCKFPEFEVVFYNYDEFVSNGKLILYPNTFEDGICIYRGWMLKPDQYATLYERLLAKGLRLINNIDEYKKCHLFPNIYDDIKLFTPKTQWFEDYEDIDWGCINAEFNQFMIKDYVKSVKGTSFPSQFETPVIQEIMKKYIDTFIELRGSLFTNGIVIKAFVNFKRYGEISNEYRAFFMKGKLLTLSKNSNQPANCPAVPDDFVAKFIGLKSNFYTVDFAELEDGRWIVIETGDGQVSGLSPNQYVFKFYDEMRRVIDDLDK